ncbi:MAG: hypothetical protein GY820_02000, partial [Gammaproteobacteria bacterium]|nr:hypothetical protein [Gammaproteobacteria bacterium]
VAALAAKRERRSPVFEGKRNVLKDGSFLTVKQDLDLAANGFDLGGVGVDVRKDNPFLARLETDGLPGDRVDFAKNAALSVGEPD